jgi:putative transport protein
VGTLLAGVAIGQLNIQVPAVVKYVFFDLFLFTTGYKVGPQFFRALKKDALPQLAITLVLCLTCLIAAYTAAKLLGYDVGTAAGMLAGAFTNRPSLEPQATPSIAWPPYRTRTKRA